MYRSFLFIIVTVVLSCKNIETHPAVSTKDSIMKKYFTAVDSLPFGDTSSQAYELMKAYYRNDTFYLKRVQNEVEDLLKQKRQMVGQPICKSLPNLRTLNFDEGYQFEYDAAFCDKIACITIGKISDSISLNFVLYQINFERTKCDIVNHIEKKLEKKDWDVLIDNIYVSDFWGLLENNGSSGFDGSNLTVAGYEKPINAFKGRYKLVYRWASESSALGLTFKKMLDLTGVKVDCFHYKKEKS